MAIADVLKKLFGSKSDRDMKAIRPVVDQILQLYPDIDKLSNDELRAHSAAIRAKIAAVEKPFEDRIAEIKAELDKDIPVSEKESLATESDRLVKDEDDAIEKVLTEVLPEAFAIVKSTARRFAQNETIEVTATEFDKDLAAAGKDFLEIEGDKAIWKNHWVAGGNEITWDMVHYDVQLIGGIVLHQGKIAEMATGEGKTLVATLPVFLNALAGKGVHVVTVNDYLSKRDSEWMGPLYQFHGLSVDCIDKHQPNSDSRKRAYECDITFGTNNEFGFDYLRDNMAVRQTDLVQRKHHFAIVDEVDSVLIDDARTPLIISGPMSKASGDEQFMEYRPYVENLYNKQRALVTQTLNEAKRLIAAGDEKEGGKLLFRCHKGLPKYQPLIKFLSEPGMKQLMQKTEAFYLQDNEREMPQITDELYFVINEVLNSVDMTDKGHDALAGSVSDPNFFVLPDMGSAIAEISHDESLSAVEKAEKKDALMEDFSLKSERVHTVIQLLKAYAMFTKDIDYVIVDNKVKIVDESTGRIMEGRRWSDGLHQAVEAKENVKVEAATQTFATVTLQNYFRMYHKLAGMTGTAETEAGEFWDIYKLDVVVIPTNRPVIRDDQDDIIYKTKKAKYAAVIDRVVELSEAGRPVLVGTTDVETSELLARMMRMRGLRPNVLNAKEHAREAEIVAQAGQSGKVTIATNMAGRGTDIKLTPEVKAAGGLAIIGTTRHDSRRVDRQLRGRAGRQGDPGDTKFYISLEDELMRLYGGERISAIMGTLRVDENMPLESGMLSKTIENAQKKKEGVNFAYRKQTLQYDDVMNRQRELIYSQRNRVLDGEDLKGTVLKMIDDTIDAYVNLYLADDAIHDNWDLKGLREYFLGWITDENDLHYTTQQLGDIEKSDVADFLKEKARKKYAEREEKFGDKLMREIERVMLLRSVDTNWMDHIDAMDQLKNGIHLRAYGQHDPVVEYRNESYDMFTAMTNAIREQTSKLVLTVQVRDDSQVKREKVAEETSTGEKPATVRGKGVVSKNAPCPCGSGKKYKRCCGKGLD